MGMQNGSKLERQSMLQCLPIKKKKITGVRGMLTTLYQTLCIWLSGCMLALCGSTMHPARLYYGICEWTTSLACGKNLCVVIDMKQSHMAFLLASSDGI